jgi:serine/threonine protein kinase/WD40 repeat protein
MNERLKREESLFDAAIQLPPDDRADFLTGACENDLQLCHRVESLLKSHLNAGGILEQPALVQPDSHQPPHFSAPEEPGDRIGRYKLLEQIGEGGCGVVYLAEQQEPVRRCVALKVIKLGMDTKQVIARFEAERQALAMMDHPNISKVLDAGAAETGRPYFVMELVHGTKITDYCDQKGLSTRERLELFVQVCRAVQHAHQKGIIHRDLKPSNVLVTLQDGQPAPKIIDFGIAKATSGQQFTGQTLFTAFEQFLGTPAYMSPEQAQMTSQDIDTRSDIYSLGVLLYELLTGKTPFDSKELLRAGLDTMRRTILETEPQRPSTKLNAMAQVELVKTAGLRRTEPPRLISLVRGDLDWIVMKCLEKDRSRRYETANGLALDIQRHLRNEPVAARPPSKLYRTRKLVQRNKVALVAVMAVFVALLLGLVSSTLLFLRETRESKRARAAEADATERLHGSYLAQAQAGRWSKRAGRRFSGLELLAKAAAIQPSLELRNEAIACMALTDLCQVKEVGFDDMNKRQFCRFDPDFKRYLVVDTNATIHMRRVSDDGELAKFPGYSFPFSYLEFSPNGRFIFIACGPQRDRVEVRDLDAQNTALLLKEPMFRTLDFSPDSRLVAISYESEVAGHPIRIFDLSSKRQVASFHHGSLPFFIRFNPAQTNLLLTSDASSTVRIWDWRSGQEIREFEHPDDVRGISWSPDGTAVATGCDDSKVRIWDVASDIPPDVLSGHDGAAVWVDFRGGGLLASRGWDGKLCLWDVFRQREITSLMAPGLAPFSQHGRTLEVYTGANRIALLKISTGTGYRVLQHRRSDGLAINCDFSADGQLLLCAHPEAVFVWDTLTGKDLAQLSATNQGCFARFHPRGTNIFLGTTNSIENWSFTSTPLREKLDLVRQRVWPIEYRKNIVGLDKEGRKIVTAADGAIRVLDSRTGEVTLQTPPSNYEFAALSPDGRMVAAWSRVGIFPQPCTNVDVWAVASTNLLCVLPASGGVLVAFSPDSRRLSVGDETKFVLWDTRTWRPMQTIPRQFSGYYGYVAFSSDNFTLALASSRDLVQLRDAVTGAELATLESPDRLEITWLTFSPDGTQLAVACSSGAIQLWDLRAIRQQLASMKLDWNLPPFPPPDHAAR